MSHLIWNTIWPGGVSHESTHFSKALRIIEPNVFLSIFQRTVGKRAGGGFQGKTNLSRGLGGQKEKNTGDLVLFWETNKRSNVSPREAWGPLGCHASRQMWQTDELGFTTERASDETPAWGGAATGVHVCECDCVHVWQCVCVSECLRLSSSEGGGGCTEQLSPLVITSQQKQEWLQGGWQMTTFWFL